jgi:nicotinate-nucleotide adenylyltransferase
MSKRIGIFSGSFDPVHKGHVAFALAALESAQLDEVYFAPERWPRRKPEVTHLSHRLAMLKLATRLHPRLNVLELPDRYFSSSVTLPRIIKKFPNDHLFMLLGSDLLENLHHWPKVEYLLRSSGLIIGVRGEGDVVRSLDMATALPKQPQELHIVEALEPHISSRYVRHAIREGRQPRDILSSVLAYAKRHWLYPDLAAAERKLPPKR